MFNTPVSMVRPRGTVHPLELEGEGGRERGREGEGEGGEGGRERGRE